MKPLLNQIALLLREGVSGWIRPDPFNLPYWENWEAKPERDGAPEGHWLFAEGTKLYVADTKAKVEAPYCIVAQNGDAVPMDQRVPSAMWRVPVVVEMAWEGDDDDAKIRERVSMLMGMLVIDYPGRPAAERLSQRESLEPEGNVFVFGNDTITDVKPEPLRMLEGHPVARLSFTVLCAALPPANVVADQPEDATLGAVEYTDVFDSLVFWQRTPGRTITLEAPSDLSRKTITVTHRGTEDFTLWPAGMNGGVAIEAGSSDVLLHWDDVLQSWAPGL